MLNLARLHSEISNICKTLFSPTTKTLHKIQMKFWNFLLHFSAFLLLGLRTLTHFEIETSLQTLFRLSSRLQLFLATTQRAAVSICSANTTNASSVGFVHIKFTSHCVLQKKMQINIFHKRNDADADEWIGKKGRKMCRKFSALSSFFLCNETLLWACRRLDNVRAQRESCKYLSPIGYRILLQQQPKWDSGNKKISTRSHT